MDTKKVKLWKISSTLIATAFLLFIGIFYSPEVKATAVDNEAPKVLDILFDKYVYNAGETVKGKIVLDEKSTIKEYSLSIMNDYEYGDWSFEEYAGQEFAPKISQYRDSQGRLIINFNLEIPSDAYTTTYGFWDVQVFDTSGNETRIGFYDDTNLSKKHFKVVGKYAPSVYYVKEDSSYGYYKRVTPTYNKWTTVYLVKGQRFIGGKDGDKFIYRLKDGTKEEMPFNLVTTTQTPRTNYTIGTVNIRNASTNKVIATLPIASTVNGIDKGINTYFTYNGIQAKVSNSVLAYG